LAVEFKILLVLTVVLLLSNLLAWKLFRFWKPLLRLQSLTLLFFLVAELFIRFSSVHVNNRSDHWVGDDIARVSYYFGHELLANKTANHQAFIKDSLLFNVTYHTDSLAFRSSISSKVNAPRYLLLGGKEVFGEGLSDSLSLGSQLFKRDSTKQFLNKGLMHYNILHSLAIADSLYQVNKYSGMMVLVKPSDMKAIVANRSYLDRRGDKSPYYVIEESQLCRKSNILEGRSTITGCMKLINHSFLLKSIVGEYYTEEEKLIKLKQAFNQLRMIDPSCLIVLVNEEEGVWNSHVLESLIKDHEAIYLDMSYNFDRIAFVNRLADKIVQLF
jgi:hypothetical protein